MSLRMGWLFACVLVARWLDPAPVFSETCSPSYSSWLSSQLLDSLPPAIASQRATTVQNALASFPGGTETFILSLMSFDFLADQWSGLYPSYGSGDPGQMFTCTPGRTAYSYGSQGSAPTRMLSSVYKAQTYGYVSPLLLDLNGDGIPGVPGGQAQPAPGIDLQAASTVAFDINGDGFEELTQWIDGNDGLLVEPTDPAKVVYGPAGLTWNGPLTGRDLLGTSEGYVNGFQKLALRDISDENIISGPELSGLYLWTDVDANARIDDGELKTLAMVDITALAIPTAGVCNGSFTRKGQIGVLWDWWPNYALAQKQPATPSSWPTSVVLSPQPGLMNGNSIISLQVTAEGRVMRMTLDAAGLDYGSATIVRFAPDGSRLLLQDRMTDPTQVLAGFGRRLWILTRPKTLPGSMPVIIMPLPCANIQQVVLETNNSALVVGDGGAKILRVNLESGEWSVLMEPVPNQPGFRAGYFAGRDSEKVYLSGTFYNAQFEEGNDVLASENDPQTLEAVVDLEAIRDSVRQFGTIAQELLVSPDLGYFVVVVGQSPSLLVVYDHGLAYVADTNIQPGGLAASGQRVLYFAGASQADTPADVCVYDVSSKCKLVLGQGVYSYPYLENKGQIAVVTRIDWDTPVMSAWTVAVLAGEELRPVFATPAIGALRVSDDGRILGYLGPDGLAFASLTGRGDYDADGDVDRDDYMFFEDCVSGPSILLMAGCESSDYDRDNDVDQSDFGVFQRCYSGAGLPADPECGEPDSVPVIVKSGKTPCKPQSLTEDGYPWCGDDKISLTPKPGMIEVIHYNAAYNCCPDDIKVELSFSGRTLRLAEKEILTIPCACLCCYDVTSTIAGLEPGLYRVEYSWVDEEVGPTTFSAEIVVP